MSVHDRIVRPRMIPSTALRLALHLVLLTLPGWRVPGQAIRQGRRVRCPFDHGWAELRNDGRSAYCSASRHGWFTWANCPTCRAPATTVGDERWLCDNRDEFVALRCTASGCPGVATARSDGSWVCTTAGHVLQPFGRTCRNCRSGRAVRHPGRGGGNCSTCGRWAAHRG